MTPSCLKTTEAKNTKNKPNDHELKSAKNIQKPIFLVKQSTCPKISVPENLTIFDNPYGQPKKMKTLHKLKKEATIKHLCNTEIKKSEAKLEKENELTLQQNDFMTLVPHVSLS